MYIPILQKAFLHKITNISILNSVANYRTSKSSCFLLVYYPRMRESRLFSSFFHSYFQGKAKADGCFLVEWPIISCRIVSEYNVDNWPTRVTQLFLPFPARQYERSAYQRGEGRAIGTCKMHADESGVVWIQIEQGGSVLRYGRRQQNDDGGGTRSITREKLIYLWRRGRRTFEGLIRTSAPE